jgi:hypothetical protein
MQKVKILIVVLSVITPNVVVPNVVAPNVIPSFPDLQVDYIVVEASISGEPSVKQRVHQVSIQ